MIKNGLKVLIYSGDSDAVVPFEGTRQWVRNLDLPVASNWTQWYVDDQVAGFYELLGSTIDGPQFMFATIKGVGMRAAHWASKLARELVMNNFLISQD